MVEAKKKKVLFSPTSLIVEPDSLGSHLAPVFTSCVTSGLQVPDL